MKISNQSNQHPLPTLFLQAVHPHHWLLLSTYIDSEWATFTLANKCFRQRECGTARRVRRNLHRVESGTRPFRVWQEKEKSSNPILFHTFTVVITLLLQVRNVLSGLPWPRRVLVFSPAVPSSVSSGIWSIHFPNHLFLLKCFHTHPADVPTLTAFVWK